MRADQPHRDHVHGVGMLAHDRGRQLGFARADRLRQRDMLARVGDQMLGLNRQMIGQPLEPTANILYTGSWPGGITRLPGISRSSRSGPAGE